MRKRKSIFLLLIAFVLITSVVMADPEVVSVTLNPPAPSFGQAVTIDVVYCGQLYNSHEIAIAISTQSTLVNAALSGVGQVFVVSAAGIDVPTSKPASTPGGEIGWEANPNPSGADSNNCAPCSGGQGHLYTKQYVVHVPSPDYFPGCSVSDLYVHVGMKDSNLNEGEWHTRTTCTSESTSWAIPLLPADFSLHKRAEGVVQDDGDLLLFSVDFDYANGPLTITDPIPGGGAYDLVSFGPASISGGSVSGPAIGSNSGTISWTFPNRTGLTGSSTGTVWMLLREHIDGSAPTSGTVVSNTATGTMNSNVKNASTNVTVGAVVMTLYKSQSDPTLDFGDIITYYLEYNINGSKLVAYQPFDDIPLGAYTGGNPPPGWDFIMQAGTTGVWTVEDYCNTGDRIIRGDSANDQYPGMVYTGYNFCQGIIVSDVLIDPSGTVAGGGYEGSDALIVIRSNGLDEPAGAAYGFVLSIDDFIGTNSNGNIGFQRCDPGGCIWPMSVDTIQISGNKWYRVKIEATGPYTFRAKVWAKGDPEPGWMITWTDGSPPAGLSCAAAPYAGYGQQGGANGSTQDIYNNFIIYEPRVSGNTYLYDTIPADLNYSGSSPNGTQTGGMITWNLGNISDEGGTYTWWATVDGCDPITNIGGIDGDDPIIPVISNETVLIPICPTPVITVDKTFDGAGPFSQGDAITWNIEVCNSAAGPDQSVMYTWDTIPAQMLFGGFIDAPMSGSGAPGTLVVWDISPLNAGQCKTVSWWGTANHMPFNPFWSDKVIFAMSSMSAEDYAVSRTMDLYY